MGADAQLATELSLQVRGEGGPVLTPVFLNKTGNTRGATVLILHPPESCFRARAGPGCVSGKRGMAW